MMVRKDETPGWAKQTACGKNRGQQRTDPKILEQKLDILYAKEKTKTRRTN